MKTNRPFFTPVVFLLLSLLLASAPAAVAATMADYSIVPPFVQQPPTPNLLMLFDNSASMYDLSYPDLGKKSSTGTITRQPYYCYDQTYSSANTYAGYFENSKFYSYNLTSEYFQETATFPASCTKRVANQLCIDISGTSVTNFVASGNYLNWLSASKFDVQKKVLTGGKYNTGTQNVEAESRGCVGQSFVKEANTGNFVNYDSPETNNTNTSLGITFGIRGPYDTVNRSAPSPGGQTYIDIYQGNYNQADCQDAVVSIMTGGNADIKQDVGACLTSLTGTTTTTTKTQVAFQQSMQACWQYREGKAIGGDDINTVENQCTDIYDEYATCSNNPQQTCTTNADCGAGNTCIFGPGAIVPGNSALLCSSEYEGQYYYFQGAGTAGTCSYGGGACTTDADCSPATYKQCKKSTTICTTDAQCAAVVKNDTCSKTIINTCTTTAVSAGWALIPGTTEAQMIATHTQFCSDVTATPVTDPTDSPSDTSLYENTPAILSGVGLAAQLNQPLRTLAVKLHTTTTPKGLIDEFKNSIRFGAMQFNFNGSVSECSSTSTVKCPKVCSNDSSRTCTTNIDCVSPGTCVAATGNLDGAQIFHSVGAGHCSSTTTTACATDSNCPTGETCVNDGVGTHASGLIAGIDAMRGSTWTPFSEAFYNAIGYFARTSSGTSRTDLRLNTSDYNASLNPVQSECQKNFVLIVSDGTSTTDQNSSVSNLASLYGTAALSGADTGTCSSYAGSQNLDNLAWLARNRNIKDFSTSTVSTTAPAKESEYISTYVVYNGTSNGQSGDCESETIMSKTAAKGGGQYYQPTGDPSDPNNGLYTKMRAAFESIASVGSSATAASILSNSDNNGSNLLQALFYPSKYFGSTKITWLGEVHGLWFYIDPYLTKSTIREDTDSDKKLKLKNDYVVHLAYNSTHSQTEVAFQQDTNGDGSGDTTVLPSGRVSANTPPYLPDDMKSLWRGGKSLLGRTYSDRTIKVSIDDSASLKTTYSSLYGAGTNMIDFIPGLTTANIRADRLKPFLDLTDTTDAANLINYIRGLDMSGTRNRTVTYDGVTGVWKLGDIIASTPKIQSGVKLQNYDVSVYGGGYGDASYYDFTNTSAYKQRGMAYVGANDGMLHAFNIGSFGKGAANTDEVSVITGTNIGKEEWAFIPMQALPYLKYLRNTDYTHLYYMDTSPTLLDASINKVDIEPTLNCTSSLSYWDCAKSGDSWRTILIGGMGLGGASRIKGSTCTDCVKTPVTDPDNASIGVGYSSYFALDITNPASPSLLWEFSNPQLGFATSGPAIVRVGDKTRNGRWFAVFASGPTGPIDTDTHQFLGRSDQNLRLFVVDLATGSLVRTIDTGIANAFGASMLNSTLDTDKFDGRDGVYTDDVLYVGYVKKNSSAAVWDKGGVIRVATRDLLNTSAKSYSPDDPGWLVSKVIDDIGPVTSGIGRIIDRQTGKLWLYFGTGRFYYRTIGLTDMDGASDQLALYGITDPCFQNNDISETCVSSSPSSLTESNLLNQTTNPSGTLGINDKGWYINLYQRDNTSGYFAERVITDPVAATNGVVYFTSFKPSQDTCSFSGDTYLWAVTYNTGGAMPTALRSGKIVLQVSTGAFQEVDIGSAFTQRDNRATTGLGGIPSGAGTAPSIISNAGMTPVRKILHVRER